jgi:aerobic-type carbon monoxide dehydrogenase small subunit (CoxS/CutS family)
MKSTALTTLVVNGTTFHFRFGRGRTLLQLIREDLSLSGTCEGCGGGDCGACAMLVDGKRTLACVTRAEFGRRKSITTVEGVAADIKLRPIHDAFMENPAFPCGVCGPGMVVSLIAYMNEEPDLSDSTLIARMSTNTCNCCGYPRIHSAITRAAAAYRSAHPRTGASEPIAH